MTRAKFLIVAVCALVVMTTSYIAYAQNVQTMEGSQEVEAPGIDAKITAIDVPISSEAEASGDVAPFISDEYASLVFTYWEQTAIDDARQSRGLVRAPTDAELMRELNKRDETPKRVPTPEEREITLGGIVYHDHADWTIWLNNKRVTPDALPEEVIDLRVFKGYVEMKWFDEYTNQIFPIRLRPHQRFNIDARIFLPG